jgi:hypothetical protein
MKSTVYQSKFYDFEMIENILLFRWKDTTKVIDDNGFQEGLANFAGYAIELSPSAVVIDLRNFHGRPSSKVASDWRKAVAVPRYNRSGLKKFAYIKGENQGGQPTSLPTKHHGELFETAVFSDLNELSKWLGTKI